VTDPLSGEGYQSASHDLDLRDDSVADEQR